MTRKKTHEEFVAEVKALVGDEYTVVGEYVNSRTKLVVRHEVCDKTHPVKPNNFLQGSRCPTCYAKSKKKTTEEFKEEVYKLVEGEYKVASEYINSYSKIDMLHTTCGEVYSVNPSSFLRGDRCPTCFKNHKKTTEEFKEEVYKLVEGEYKVASEYINSYSKIDMLHTTCGEVYSVNPSSFLRGRRCPTCFKNHKKTTEEFKEEVYKLVEGEYKVASEYINSYSKIDMLHTTCGEVYSVNPNSFLTGRRCPKCRESKGERQIADFLIASSVDFEQQKLIYYSKKKRPLKLDFYVQGVAIEYDGELHYKPIEHFGGETKLRAQQRRDAIKDKYCADNGIPLIRIPYWDFDNIDAILTEKLLPLLREKAA